LQDTKNTNSISRLLFKVLRNFIRMKKTSFILLAALLRVMLLTAAPALITNESLPTRQIYIDFGPVNCTSGAATVNPDVNGTYWNNYTGNTANSTMQILDKTNASTGLSITTLVNFSVNPGAAVMSLTNPTVPLLGDLAIGTATQDFFFAENSKPSLKISGLNTNNGYKFFVYGSRIGTETRVSKYTFTGTNSCNGTLQTTGTNLGGTGVNVNNSTLYTTPVIYPDANGEIKLELTNVTSAFGYLNLIKMEEYNVSMLPVTAISVSGAAITTESGTSQMTAAVVPANATIQEVTWSVSDPSVATINSDGLLTAYHNGTVSVIATTKEAGSSISGNAQIIVSNQPTAVPTKQVFIDFGPNDVINGNRTLSPDLNGNYWNNVISETAGSTLTLVDKSNTASGMTFKVTFGMSKNGILNGGLLVPNTSYLGEFAIATATQDYFFTSTSGQFKLSGLNANKCYRFRIFGSRDDSNSRLTDYTITGSNSFNASYQSSGLNIGGTGVNTNNSKILYSSLLYPTSSGEITIDMKHVSGAFSHINILKIEEYDVEMVPVTGVAVTGEDITTSGTASQMTATISPSNATIKDVTWTVDNLTIATIDKNGLLQPLKNGSVTVTATSKQPNLSISGTKLINISNQFKELYLSGTATEGGENIETALPMKLVTDLQGKSNGTFNLFTTLGSTGTLRFFSSKEATATVFGAGATAGTIESAGASIDPTETGLVLLSVNLTSKTYTITPIQKMGVIGSVGEILLTYKGNGVYSDVVDMSKVVNAANKNFSFRANADLNFKFRSIKGSLNDLCLESQALALGMAVEDIAAGVGNYTVSIDLNHFTYLVTCPLVDPLKITIMGSSVAYGSGATSNYGYNYKYTQLLKQRYTAGTGLNWTVINKSVGGNTTQNVLDRWNSDLVSQCGKYVVYGLSMANEGLHEAGDKQIIFNRFKDNMGLLIAKSRAKGMVPVVVNNYTRADFTTSDYAAIKQINLLIHDWDVPSINSLGAVDDGAGHWAAGYQNDNGHPNDLGHAEMALAMVPSLYDALDAGKPLPQRASENLMQFDNSLNAKQLVYTPDHIVHPFTISFDIKTNGNGRVASFKNGTNVGTLSIDSLTGTICYTTTAGKTIKGKVVVNDGEWHKVTLTHYYARRATILYTDKTLEGSLVERLLASQFYLNDLSAPILISYRDLFFYRSGMNADEITALYNGKMLKSSLDLYAPLFGNALEQTTQLTNIAQSTTTLKMNDAVGIKKPAQFSKLKVYPNPVSDILTLDGLRRDKEYECSVYGIDGRLALKDSLNEENVLNVSTLAASQYILVLKDLHSSDQVKLVFTKK